MTELETLFTYRPKEAEETLEGGYKGLVELTDDHAQDAVHKSRFFLRAIKELFATP